MLMTSKSNLLCNTSRSGRIVSRYDIYFNSSFVKIFQNLTDIVFGRIIKSKDPFEPKAEFLLGGWKIIAIKNGFTYG